MKIRDFLAQFYRSWRTKGQREPSLESVQRVGVSAETMCSQMQRFPWCLDSVSYDGRILRISGWAIAPDQDFSRVGFSVNDRVFGQIDYGMVREDIGDFYWYLPNASRSGFVSEITIERNEVFKNGYTTLSYIDAQSGYPFWEKHNYYYYDDFLNKKVSIPDAVNRKRVHGSDNENAFLIEGFTNYIKLQLILNELFQKNFQNFNNILDWGCGCGRLTRYFHECTNSTVTGIDIDKDNIAWCRVHLPFAQFIDSPLYPPTSLPNSSFDLIIGISIFTHLKEDVEKAWLQELQRVVTKDGIVLVTVHGDAAFTRLPARLQREFYWKYRQDGFLDIGPNFDLNEVINDGYYRNTFHTAEYIQAHWSNYFTILNIVPGYIGNFHDLIVMRSK